MPMTASRRPTPRRARRNRSGRRFPWGDPRRSSSPRSRERAGPLPSSSLRTPSRIRTLTSPSRHRGTGKPFGGGTMGSMLSSSRRSQPPGVPGALLPRSPMGWRMPARHRSPFSAGRPLSPTRACPPAALGRSLSRSRTILSPGRRDWSRQLPSHRRSASGSTTTRGTSGWTGWTRQRTWGGASTCPERGLPHATKPTPGQRTSILAVGGSEVRYSDSRAVSEGRDATSPSVAAAHAHAAAADAG